METITFFQHIFFENGLLQVDISQTQKWYPILYQIAFSVGLILFVYSGIRKNYPLSSWLIISASATFFIIIGSKLGTFTPEDWKMVFSTGKLIPTGSKTAVGAFLFGVAGLMLITRFLRFRAPIWGAFAFFLPAVMLVQRAGCMLAGCCYGKSTALPMGISYFGPGMLRDHQIMGGQLPIQEWNTLPVHNVPFYYMLTAFGTIFLLLWMRNRVRNQESLIALSLLCMAGGRFIVEFFRDIGSHHNNHLEFLGLKTLQWMILVVVILMVILFRHLEKKPNRTVSPPIFPFRNLLTLSVLAFAMFSLYDWFTPIERTTAYTQMTLAVLLNMHLIWVSKPNLRPVFPAAILAATTFTLMAQQPQLAEPNFESKTFINMYGTKNTLNRTHYPCLQVEQGCGGEYCALGDSLAGHGPRMSTFSFGVEHHAKSFGHIYGIVGLDVVSERFYNNNPDLRNFQYFHLAPYLGVGSKNVNFIFGFRAGEIYNALETQQDQTFRFLPMFNLRLGSQKSLIHFRFGLFDQYNITGISPSFFTTSLLVSPIRAENVVFRIGMQTGIADYTNSSLFGLNSELEFPKQKLLLAPMFGITKSIINETAIYYPQLSLRLQVGL